MGKRLVNKEVMLRWREDVGGPKEAIRLIMAELECCFSKAEKLQAGSYDRELCASEEKTLAALMKRPRDVVFITVGKRERRVS